MTLKSGLEVTQSSMSLKVVPFKSLGAVSYSTSVVTMTVYVAICDIFNVKQWPDLETGLGFVQASRSLEMAPLIDRIRV